MNLARARDAEVIISLESCVSLYEHEHVSIVVSWRCGQHDMSDAIVDALSGEIELERKKIIDSIEPFVMVPIARFQCGINAIIY